MKFISKKAQQIANLYFGAINIATLVFVSVSAKAAELGVPIPGNGGTSEASYGEYIESAYGFAMKLGIGLTTLMIIYAGYKYMTSQGNPTAINEAKDIIVGSLSGFALLLLIYWVLDLLDLPKHYPAGTTNP